MLGASIGGFLAPNGAAREASWLTAADSFCIVCSSSRAADDGSATASAARTAAACQKIAVLEAVECLARTLMGQQCTQVL